MQLAEKLSDIEDAFNILGWQPEDTFQPVLMALVGDELDVLCLNRLRNLWDNLDPIDVMTLLTKAAGDMPDGLQPALFGSEKCDVRGFALMTEGWALIGTHAEVMEAIKDTKPVDHPNRAEHRVVMGMLFGETAVWGAQRIRGDLFGTPSVDMGHGGQMAEVFIDFVNAAEKGLK